MKNLVAIISATGDAVEKAHAEGLHVAGERYVVTKIEDRSLYARKVGWKKEESSVPPQWYTCYGRKVLICCAIIQGKNGIVVVKTKQAVLVGHYGENVQAGNAAQTVEQLADYLINTGY
jgi:profilin